MDSVLTLLSPSAGRLQPVRLLLRTLAMDRSRRRLADLDDHLLRDIGLSRGEASLEAERASWDAPAHWLR